jgi:hypothetical protein
VASEQRFDLVERRRVRFKIFFALSQQKSALARLGIPHHRQHALQCDLPIAHGEHRAVRISEVAERDEHATAGRDQHEHGDDKRRANQGARTAHLIRMGSRTARQRGRGPWDGINRMVRQRSARDRRR